jgi:hypothetical protein
MGPIGFPELLVILMTLALWGLPIYAAIWLLRRIAKMRRVQEEMLDRLKAIERKLDVQRPT